jgi:cold shock CspA family protein/ribosome-associated translation inhibitor RaiA
MEIHWHHMQELDPESREAAEARLRDLAGEHGDLIDLRISGRPTGHHRHGGQEVRIVCQARGQELVAARARDDLALSFQEALDAFEREVWRMRHKRQQRRTETAPEPPEMGVVDQILADRGYGFILTDGGERVYFHRNAVKHGLEFGALEEGQRVGLQIEGGAKGLQATVVMEPPPEAG